MAAEEVKAKDQLKPEAWRVFREVLHNPRYFVAPMVDGSVLPFRILCKRHGASLGYTPMIFTSVYAKDSEESRKISFDTCKEDQPVVVQLCGCEPNSICETAKLLELDGRCSALDFNLGCPQKIAKKGSYGAFLADNFELVRELVTKLKASTQLPVFCKMRLQDTIEKSVEFAKMLEDSGCMLLTIHGRKKNQLDLKNTNADWDAIAEIIKQMSIPCVANGSIRQFSDIEKCLQVTKAQAVMVGTALLANPAFFSGININPCDLACEFMSICKEHPLSVHISRGILVKMLLSKLQKWGDLMEQLVTAISLEEQIVIVDEVKRRDQTNEQGVQVFLPEKVVKSHNFELTLQQDKEGFKPWRELMVFPRTPMSNIEKHISIRINKEKTTGGWITLIGIGKRFMTTESLRSLRESLKARSWKCRDSALYFDIADEKLYNDLISEKKITVYIRELPESQSTTSTKKAPKNDDKESDSDDDDS